MRAEGDGPAVELGVHLATSLPRPVRAPRGSRSSTSSRQSRATRGSQQSQPITGSGRARPGCPRYHRHSARAAATAPGHRRSSSNFRIATRVAADTPRIRRSGIPLRGRQTPRAAPSDAYAASPFRINIPSSCHGPYYPRTRSPRAGTASSALTSHRYPCTLRTTSDAGTHQRVLSLKTHAAIVVDEVGLSAPGESGGQPRLPGGLQTLREGPIILTSNKTFSKAHVFR